MRTSERPPGCDFSGYYDGIVGKYPVHKFHVALVVGILELFAPVYDLHAAVKVAKLFAGLDQIAVFGCTHSEVHILDLTVRTEVNGKFATFRTIVCAVDRLHCHADVSHLKSA